ncbi:MAG: hypothetical protein AAFR26_23200 [Cyanobacteria bacterium J06626_4]
MSDRPFCASAIAENMPEFGVDAALKLGLWEHGSTTFLLYPLALPLTAGESE